jgi:hypothetical protein
MIIPEFILLQRKLAGFNAEGKNTYFFFLFQVRIQIMIRCMNLFFGLPDPDLIVKDMDLGPVPNSDFSTNPLSSSKNSAKNLETYCFVTFFGDLVVKKLF